MSHSIQNSARVREFWVWVELKLDSIWLNKNQTHIFEFRRKLQIIQHYASNCFKSQNIIPNYSKPNTFLFLNHNTKKECFLKTLIIINYYYIFVKFFIYLILYWFLWINSSKFLISSKKLKQKIRLNIYQVKTRLLGIF